MPKNYIDINTINLDGYNNAQLKSLADTFNSLDKL